MEHSIHRKLDRVRPPRVHISYDLELGGAIQQRELPLVIGVLGDFAGSSYARPRWFDRSFMSIDWDNFDSVLRSLKPRVRFEIPSSLTDGVLDVDLTFESIDDFEPLRIAERIEPLRILQQSATPEARDTLRRHLDRVLHAPEFQALEAAWRGLWYLVSRVESGSKLQVLLIDVTKQELLRDMERAPEFDQSILFKKVFDDRYGVVASEPFALFIGDYQFGRSERDIVLLEKLAQVAAHASPHSYRPPRRTFSSWRASRTWMRRVTSAASSSPRGM